MLSYETGRPASCSQVLDRGGGRRGGSFVKPCKSPHLGQLPVHIANASLNLLTLFSENSLGGCEGKKWGGG